MIRLRSFQAVIFLVAVIGIAGCTHITNSSTPATTRPVAFALAVTVHGGLQPSPMQWAAIQAKFAQEIAAAGHMLATDLSLADYILRIDFRPNPYDPENSGYAEVISVRRNPLRDYPSAVALAGGSSNRYPSSFGFAGLWSSSLYPFRDSSYYGYGNSYYDGYSYGSPTLNPRKPAPTHPAKPTDPTNPPHPGHHHHRHPPGDRSGCPPLLAWTPPLQHDPDPVAYPPTNGRRATFPSELNRADSNRLFSHLDRGDRADRTHARTDSGSARSSSEGTSRRTERSGQTSERTHSRSDTSYARSDSSYSRPASSPSTSSYSPPSYSTASTYSAPSSSSSSYSSSASYSSSSTSSGGASAPARETSSNQKEH